MSPIRNGYLRENRHRRCFIKVPYFSLASVAKAFHNLQAKDAPVFDFKLRVYRCPYGDHYHLGHRVRSQMFEKLSAIARVA